MYNENRLGAACALPIVVGVWRQGRKAEGKRIMTQVVQQNMVVSLAYTLKLANGEVVDQADAEEPLLYLHGGGNIIPGLERALVGMEVGDRRDVEVVATEGYGEYDPEDVMEVSQSELPARVPKVIGTVLQIQDQSGNLLEASISQVGTETVTLDFNHPLAGKTLFFNVEVVDIREATADEIVHGHPHGVFGDEMEDDMEDFGGDDFDDDEFDDDDFDDDDDDLPRRSTLN
jgi:FKBP-type peptidyl-prolyl cis-trans isomerase SlyD